VTSPVPTVRKLGPGVLTVGAVGSPLDFSGRCTTVKIVPKVDTEDDTPVLSGGVEPGDRTYTATLEATVLQDDLYAGPGGLVDYSWAHKGEQVPATFTPYTGGRSISGELIVDPLDIGGEVGKKNTSDIKWAFVGFPDLIDDLT
jgi:hypothetical protein